MKRCSYSRVEWALENYLKMFGEKHFLNVGTEIYRDNYLVRNFPKDSANSPLYL